MTFREVFGEARFLTAPTSPDAALFRGTFEAKKGEDARITICGLGYFILYINGRRVGDDEFVPPVSDYHARVDATSSYPLNDWTDHRIYAMQYDLAPYLEDGENVIGVMVGGGFYYQTRRICEGNLSFGAVKLAYRITFSDREVCSDKNVLCCRGFFRSVNLYYGELLDFSGFDRRWNTIGASTDGWIASRIVHPPRTAYYIADCPTDKVTEVLTPTLVKRFETYSVYALPYNCTGYPVVRCTRPGETIRLECAENIFPDGNLNNRSVGYGKQRETATFVTDEGALYHPYFTWFGFRYFSLTNNAQPVEVRVIHADVSLTSSFRCSNETINWYHDAFIRSQYCNMHGSIPSDCPHRERLGYTGDGQLTCETVMLQMDAEKFYRKWIADICDCQDKETGHVQHTAPFEGGGGGPAGWGGAMIVVPYMFYRQYGDLDFLREVYPNMLLYVQYMESRCDDGIVMREERDGWCLGDWCAPEKIKIPEPFVNTALFTKYLRMLRKCAEALGEKTAEIDRLIALHTDALQAKFFDGTHYAGGVQGADAIALDCGLGDEALFRTMCAHYRALGEFDTGIFGTPAVLDVLYSRGEADLATALLANTKDASFENMRRGGATTLWENWNGESSHNHPMFGAATLFLYRDLLGIRQTADSVGYEDVLISPVFPSMLDFCEGHVTTPRGKVAVQWRRADDGVHLTVCIDDGVSARLVCAGEDRLLSAGETEIVVAESD